jgi:hypothetical protein
LDRHAQLCEAVADALELASELVRTTEEQIATSRLLYAQLRETAVRVESGRHERRSAARNRGSEPHA